MGTKVKNLPIEEARRILAEQLRPRTERSGTRPDRYDEANAEFERQEDLYQVGHNAPKSKS